MWIATGFGFLMPAVRPAKTIRFGDDRTLQVRARRARDLDLLRAEYMQGKLGPTLHTPDKDYEYRAYCTPEAFAFAVAQMVMGIDYLKFKPTSLDRYEDAELHSMLNRIWSVVSQSMSTATHRRATGGTGAARPSPTRTPVTAPAGTAVDLARPATGTGWADYGDYYDDAAYVAPTAGTAYDTSPGRDTYEPEVWDQAGEPGGDDTDAVYLRIDALERFLADTRPLDHSVCDHGASANAKARCRAKRMRNAREELEGLREYLAEQYRTYLGKLADVAQSDDPVTVVGGSSATTTQENTRS
jgi:hypothetical protein